MRHFFSVQYSNPKHVIFMRNCNQGVLLLKTETAYPQKSVSMYLCYAYSYFGPNILLNTLFSNTLSLRSSLNVRYQVLHPYRTTGKIIVLYILTWLNSDHRLESWARVHMVKPPWFKMPFVADTLRMRLLIKFEELKFLYIFCLHRISGI
jgi:hypothetical protein